MSREPVHIYKPWVRESAFAQGVTVEGKFKIDTKSYKYPGGKGPRGASHFAIFQIDGVSVK